MNPELKQHLITHELLIGHITGAKMEEVPGCMKLLKRKNFINKNIVVAYTHYVILINGANNANENASKLV